MLDIITEILIVFQNFIFGKKKQADTKVRPVTIIVVIILLVLIAALIINLLPLEDKK